MSKVQPHYSLTVTYENQNFSAWLIGCYDDLNCLFLAQLNFFRYYLKCETIEELKSELETGYLVHIKKLTKREEKLVKTYIENYFDDEIDCCAVDSNFPENLPEDYDEKDAKEIMKIIL